MKIIVFVFISILVPCALTSQEIPILSNLDGLTIGQKNSSFHVEAHLDLLCDGSKESLFTLLNVIQDYLLYDENFLFIVHIFPLPYHTFSFKLSILEKFIQDVYGETMAWNYIKFVFENQDSYSTLNLSNLTDYQINNLIAENVSTWFNQTINKSEILDTFENSTYNIQARISWKFGCQRSVAGTPTHFINGIRLNDSWEFGYDEWVKLLQNYFPMKKNIIGYGK